MIYRVLNTDFHTHAIDCVDNPRDVRVVRDELFVLIERVHCPHADTFLRGDVNDEDMCHRVLSSSGVVSVCGIYIMRYCTVLPK